MFIWPLGCFLNGIIKFFIMFLEVVFHLIYLGLFSLNRFLLLLFVVHIIEHLVARAGKSYRICDSSHFTILFLIVIYFLEELLCSMSLKVENDVASAF